MTVTVPVCCHFQFSHPACSATPATATEYRIVTCNCPALLTRAHVEARLSLWRASRSQINVRWGGGGGGDGGDCGQAGDQPPTQQCVVCKTTEASAWSGGPKGKKRKYPARELRFEKPAWCCKKAECQRHCGFIEDPARTTALEQGKEVDSSEVLSELISIRGTRCAPVANLFTVLLPSLPILPHPRHSFSCLVL